ncbi:tol-pal system protein YbgF [Rhizomicrobium electricum]|uniref:Cell division coordinator CpoB n=1 Tax=Rhizomicrobium electricum TaxID=480070 RepID=A0ABN1EWA2_9PROT|nr:tol-pal system protein YbgF [Rhizomicrobium electricum]NIJ50032.1 tol-pal system protein YbgF [Rhizomicrobium electricum]
MNWRLSAAAAALMVVLCPAGAASYGYLHPIEVRGLFGESDEEKAARLKAEQRENDQDSGIAEMRQRISDLENALRQSTGQNEVLAHQIQELSLRIDRQQKDFDYKLCTLAAQQLGASTAADGSGNSLPCDPNAAVATLAAPGHGGTLGSLPVGQSGAGPAPAAPASRSQYDEAMNLLARARYDEARAAFRAFADANPKDPMAAQAVYWVGNIAFVQKDYSAAAVAFAEQIKKYPSNPQGAESMLKLGQSLIALGEKEKGCVTLGAIKGKYKQAPAGILSQAQTVRAKSCKGQ